MLPSLLTIQDLSECTGISVRSIRYYASERILPPPQSYSHCAHYTERHLQRLQLLDRLKSAHLPLGTIKACLNNLSDAEVQSLLERDELNLTAPPVEEGSATQRLAQLLSGRQLALQIANRTPPTETPPTLSGNVGDQPKEARALGESWKRISLTASLELWVRLPETDEDKRNIQRIQALLLPNGKRVRRE